MTRPADRASSLTAGPSDLTFLLERFRDAVPGVLIAELATTDGLPLGVVGADRADAERLAAVGASLHSLGLGIGRVLSDGASRLRQAFFETDGNRVFSM